MTVEVEDVNSRPYFDSEETEISLIEVTVTHPDHARMVNSVCVCVQGVMVGDVVQRFTASDDDLGVNAALQYSLEQTEPNGDTNVSNKDRYESRALIVSLLYICVQDSFIIHQYTGDLIVANTLSLGSTYRVVITATVSWSCSHNV